MTETVELRTFADAERRLASVLPTYEERPQQQALARAIESAMDEGIHLIAEAGTGTGKSFGYLIPSILSGRRVVVSTATKALQDQIAGGDLPFLHEHLGVDFRYALLKGRSNYFCVSRALGAESARVPNLSRLIERSHDPEWNGERDTLGFEVSDSEWYAVCGNSDECRELGCSGPDSHIYVEAVDRDGETDVSRFQPCFALVARARASYAQVVVVNHALYLTELIVKRETEGNFSLLGDHDVVVFDEAHEVEEYASSMFGSKMSQATFSYLAAEVRNFGHRVGGRSGERIEAAVARVMTTTTNLWAILEPGRIRASTLLENEDVWAEHAEALRGLEGEVALLSIEPSSSLKKQHRRLIGRTSSAARRFTEVVVSPFDEWVRWVEEEKTKRDEVRLVIQSCPIHVGDILRGLLFEAEEGPVAILTSATLEVRGSMGYVAGRLGIDHYRELNVGSAFDYPAQARLYVPDDLPVPSGRDRAAWSNLMRETIADLVRASEGRALLLFTSYREMRSAFDVLARRLPYECRMQGQGSNKDLAAWFMENEETVLFGTSSFFTGVDFQGSTCSLVAIDKMPFPVPTDPIIEARSEAIDREGGSSFMDYTVPMMTLTLKQGFGRLIRSKRDRGVVAILDPRLVTKRYGSGIVRSLPPAPLTTDIDEVTRFFDDTKTPAVS